MKYQNEGGPGPEQIIATLRDWVTPSPAADQAVADFVDALAFNGIIGGTDAHAKNYSVLLRGNQVRLAPMYDVASALVYDHTYPPRLRMAMRIGGEYRSLAIAGRHWRRFASGNGLDPDEVVARVDDLAARAPDAFAAAARAEAVKELGSPLPARFLDRIRDRAAECRRSLKR